MGNEAQSKAGAAESFAEPGALRPDKTHLSFKAAQSGQCPVLRGFCSSPVPPSGFISVVSVSDVRFFIDQGERRALHGSGMICPRQSFCATRPCRAASLSVGLQDHQSVGWHSRAAPGALGTALLFPSPLTRALRAVGRVLCRGCPPSGGAGLAHVPVVPCRGGVGHPAAGAGAAAGAGRAPPVLPERPR